MKTYEQAARDFYKVADQYAEFGAADTEPRWEFEKLIIAVTEGRRPKVPTTIDGWQLYDRESLGRPGSGKAAKALTVAARVAVAAARRDLWAGKRVSVDW